MRESARPESDTSLETLSSSSPRGSLFDQCGNFLRMRDVDRVAGASDFDGVALGARGVPAFEVRALIRR